MRTIVATATTEQEANDIWLAIIAEQPHIEFANINGLQVTVIYTPIAEVEAEREKVEAEQEKADQEWMQQHAQPKPKVKPAKKYKQPRPIELYNKAQDLCLDDIELDRDNGIYTIRKRKVYGGELLFSSKSGISISRQLTKMHWNKQIAQLIADGVIAS